tara:strand:+ start:148 stop:534 length:387 start_codon:yes stop_codon:yes gene_type:complete
MKFLRIFKIKGEKKLFLVFGILNFLITNIALQMSLLILPIYLATIISQVINFSLGFYLYGEKVFKVKRITLKIFCKYLMLALILWYLNCILISTLFNYGLNKNIAAIIIIPLLVIISYTVQNKYVFKI